MNTYNSHRCTSEMEIRTTLVALAPGAAAPLPPLPGKDGFHAVPDLAPSPGKDGFHAVPNLVPLPGKDGFHAVPNLVPLPVPDQFPDPTSAPANWENFLEQTRRHEWEMSQHLFAVARQRLLSLVVGTAPKSAISEIARLADFASRLGRRAVGTPDRGEAAPADASSLLVQFEEAIKQLCSENPAGKGGAGSVPVSNPQPSSGHASRLPQ